MVGERLSAVLKDSASAQVEGKADSRAEWGACARAAVMHRDLRLAVIRQVDGLDSLPFPSPYED